MKIGKAIDPITYTDDGTGMAAWYCIENGKFVVYTQKTAKAKVKRKNVDSSVAAEIAMACFMGGYQRKVKHLAKRIVSPGASL